MEGNFQQKQDTFIQCGLSKFPEFSRIKNIVDLIVDHCCLLATAPAAAGVAGHPGDEARRHRGGVDDRLLRPPQLHLAFTGRQTHSRFIVCGNN